MKPSTPCSVKPSARLAGLASTLGATALLLTACRQEVSMEPPKPAPEFVARVGDLEILRAELAEALAKRAKSTGVEANAELKQQVLDELIREKTLLAKARAAGVDRDPELVRRWERMVVAKYEAAHKPDADKQRAPTTVEVEQFYREHATDYQRPERIRVALIQVKGSAKATEEKRSELRARAGSGRRLR